MWCFVLSCVDSDLLEIGEDETLETEFLRAFGFENTDCIERSVPTGSNSFYAPQITDIFFPERLTPDQPFEVVLVSDFVFPERITHVFVAVQGAEGIASIPVEPIPYVDGQILVPLSGFFSSNVDFSDQLYLVQFFLATSNDLIGIPSKWYISVSPPLENQEAVHVQLCRDLCHRESECRSDLDEMDDLTCLQRCSRHVGNGITPNDPEMECLEREGCPAYLACMNRIELE